MGFSSSGLNSTLFSLTTRGVAFGDGSLYITYRNVRIGHLPPFRLSFLPLQQVILSAVGIPAALLAGWAVEVPYIGRKGTLAISSGKYPIVKHALHYSIASLQMQGSLVCFSSRALPPGRRTSFWDGTVVMRCAVT